MTTQKILRVSGYAVMVERDRGKAIGLGYGPVGSARTWTVVQRRDINVDAYMSATEEDFEANIRSIVDGNP